MKNMTNEKCCNGIIEFKETKRFAMCELKKGHDGLHKALMFEWKGEGTIEVDESYWFKGYNLLKIKLQEYDK
jgi:hypothetical protein